MGLSDDASMYIFDLDGDEHVDAEAHVPHQLYSVDAMHQGMNNYLVFKLADNQGFGLSGNWTRFIKYVYISFISLLTDHYPSGQPLLWPQSSGLPRRT